MAGSTIEDRMRSCPTCSRLLPDHARFCPVDGAALPTSTAADQPQTAKVCPSCRKILPGYARFCPVDSAALKDYLPDQDNQEDLASSIFDRLLGQTIEGKYRLDSYIAQGGMAVVFKATQVAIERPVVVKVMLDYLLTNEKAIQRFERESKLTGQINHPNVVQIYDVGRLDGRRPYLVMEYIPGVTLRDRLDDEGRLSIATAAMVMIQTLSGLEEAHGRGVIHRDLKPENILLQERTDRADWVKLVDFGIARLVEGSERLTRTGMVIGTAEYLAPEQLKNVEIDVRADLYSAGVLFFEMLTGRPPFEADTLEALLLKVITDRPQPPSTLRGDIEAGGPVDYVVRRSLEKDREKRYQTAQEMRLDIQQVYSGLLRRRT